MEHVRQLDELATEWRRFDNFEKRGRLGFAVDREAARLFVECRALLRRK